MSIKTKNNLLIVGNFPANTGYAWKTIEEYFLSLHDLFKENGENTILCYPEISGLTPQIMQSGIKIVKYDFSESTFFSLIRFIKKHQVKFIYFTDRPVFSLKYSICRFCGVRFIVVHDRTSGDREVSGYAKRLIKTICNKFTLFSADVAVAISEFVRDRLTKVSCFPVERTVKIWNGININRFSPGYDDYVYKQFKIPQDKKIIFSCARANKYKGIQTLIKAADILVNREKRNDMFFLYCGDGPDLKYFRSLISELNLEKSFLCPGETQHIDKILKGISALVIPSIWQEGFGLTAIEGMATGKVVIASHVGGLKEIISDRRTGFYFTPGDKLELSRKIHFVMSNPEVEKTVGRAARRSVVDNFNIVDKKRELQQIFKSKIDDIL